MLHELSLFSGYGGFSLGLKLAGIDVKTVGYVEIEPYCQEIIKARIKDKVLDDAPIYPDIYAFNGNDYRGLVDIITGGVPCPPFSAAGKRLGKADDRNMFPETLRVIREIRPSYVLLENVRGLADGPDPYAKEVIGELSTAGYDARWCLRSAEETGAPHQRYRWWCLANRCDVSNSSESGTGMETPRINR